MTSFLRKQARRDQSHNELNSLHQDVQDWLKYRRARDSREGFSQHTTHLIAVEKLIAGAILAFQSDIASCDPALETGEFYRRCHRVDQYCIWLRRVWLFFKTKFDQRDDPQLKAVLQAADEIAWSCYHPLFETYKFNGGTLKEGPPPLTFIEPFYAFEAFPAQMGTPASLQDRWLDRDFLNTYLKNLPIPLVRLPPTCVLAPWWLVLIGHEVGHHAQYDLQLVNWFSEQVKLAIHAHGGSAEEVTSWGEYRARELFADIFSVVAMGPWALAGLADLERHPTERMLQSSPRTAYPSPAIRLQLLARTAERLHLDWLNPFQSYDLDLDALLASNASASRDLSFLATLIDLELGPLPTLSLKLEDLFSFQASNFAPNKAIARWQAYLLAQTPSRPATTMHTARLIACASLQAWFEVSLLEDPASRHAQAAALAKKTVDTLIANREVDTRSAQQIEPIGDLGGELARFLRQASPEQLEDIEGVGTWLSNVL